MNWKVLVGSVFLSVLVVAMCAYYGMEAGTLVAGLGLATVVVVLTGRMISGSTMDSKNVLWAFVVWVMVVIIPYIAMLGYVISILLSIVAPASVASIEVLLLVMIFAVVDGLLIAAE